MCVVSSSTVRRHVRDDRTPGSGSARSVHEPPRDEWVRFQIDHYDDITARWNATLRSARAGSRSSRVRDRSATRRTHYLDPPKSIADGLEEPPRGKDPVEDRRIAGLRETRSSIANDLHHDRVLSMRPRLPWLDVACGDELEESDRTPRELRSNLATSERATVVLQDSGGRSASRLPPDARSRRKLPREHLGLVGRVAGRLWE